jgi:transaldolase
VIHESRLRSNGNLSILQAIALSEHGSVTGTLPRDGGDCERVLANYRDAGIDLDKLAVDLQSQGAKSFDESWGKLLDAIEIKGKVLLGAA